jgi:hypothetical protein
MKKNEDLFFTVTKILSSAQKFEQMQFFYQLLENDMLYTYGILLSVEQLTLFVSSRWHFWKKCRAVKIRADAFWAVDPDSSTIDNFGVRPILFTSKLLDWWAHFEFCIKLLSLSEISTNYTDNWNFEVKKLMQKMVEVFFPCKANDILFCLHQNCILWKEQCWC